MAAAVVLASAGVAHGVVDGVGDVFLRLRASDSQQHRFSVSVGVFVGGPATQDGASRDGFAMVEVTPAISIFVREAAFEGDSSGWYGRHGRAGLLEL
jgi:hypothetical protein